MDEKPLTQNELLKAASPTLAGTIAETLANNEAEKFEDGDSQLLKFHGIYQQDDRDKRRVKREYSVMVRTRQTGGVAPAAQYLVYDALADRFGNGTLRLTTRQTFQFHGVVKGDLRRVVHTINAALSTTIATAGDINRNVTAPPAPDGTDAQKQVRADAFAVTRALIPTATAYHQIWIDGSRLDPALTGLVADAQATGAHPYPIPQAAPAPDGTDATDPLYGKTYLPRKFKIGFAIPPRNDTDVLTNDLGFIAIVENGAVAGYNVVAGGGLGASHGIAATFPRLASPLGFVPRERVVDIARAAVATHRDFGDRTNRRHARLKYLIEERGAAWFAAELETRIGFAFAPSRPAAFTVQGDAYGWRDQSDGKKALSLFVEAGRIKDTAGRALKTALREVVAKFRPQLYLTPTQNIILGDIAPDAIGAVEAAFTAHGVDVNAHISRTRGASMACPALPTCGFALAEAEREFPRVIGEIETLLGELGLGDEEIFVRITGCPNGCARPYAGEIGLIGTAPGRYNLMLGGDHTSTRLNRLYRQNVKIENFSDELRPLLERFKNERVGGEHFGDFAARAILEPV